VRPVLLAMALVLGIALFASTGAQGPPVWMLLQPVEASGVEIVATLALVGGGGLVLLAVAAAVVRVALRFRRPQPPTYGVVLMRGVPIATAALVVLSLAMIGWKGSSGAGGMVLRDALEDQKALVREHAARSLERCEARRSSNRRYGDGEERLTILGPPTPPASPPSAPPGARAASGRRRRAGTPPA